MSMSRKKPRTWSSQEETVEEDELLVFGYSCKLFRDDEKAAFIDEGRHLIPWMGDESLQIDRYDGRGYLHDLHQFEPVDGPTDPWDDLPEDERYMEQLCDNERYMSLNKNVTDEDLYHEEELKRLRAALADDGTYNQVNFSYDDLQRGNSNNGSAEASGEKDEGQSEAKDDDEDEEFIPSPELKVPPGMVLPQTTKINAIIEKTAMFVSKQGPQMEIVIKAKQANNPLFAFLLFDDDLNPYYKHVVQAMKSGKYVPQARPVQANDEEGDEDESDDEHYLHPSLLSSRRESHSVLTVPKILYQRTGDDPYSLLVSQMKDKVFPAIRENSGGTSGGVSSDTQRLSPVVMDSSLPPPPGLEPVTLPPPIDSANAGPVLNADGTNIPLPPPELQAIVDKMAAYVAKNGEDFEEVVIKSKGNDARFEFLRVGHQYHSYYQHKRKCFEKEIQEKRAAEAKAENLDSDKEKNAAVVSFSITRAKDSGDAKSTLTTGENEESTAKINLQEGPEAATARNEGKKDELKLDRPRATQSLEAKIAEERIRDRLAAAARERLVQVSREKQLQMERKRKAALFLTLLQKGKEEDSNLIGPRLPTPAELEVLVNGEGDLPLVPPSTITTTTLSMVSVPALGMRTPSIIPPILTAAAVLNTTDKDIDALVSAACAMPTKSEGAVSSSRNSQSRNQANGKEDRRRRSRSRSRSRTSSYRRRRRSRSRSRSRDRKRSSKKDQRRSRSSSRRRHATSSSSFSDDRSNRKRKSSRSPPAAYASERGSESVKRRRDHSRSVSRSKTTSSSSAVAAGSVRGKQERTSRSRSKSKESRSSRSRSVSAGGKRSRKSRSRSKSSSKHSRKDHHHSGSKAAGKSRQRSCSRSRKRRRDKNKHREAHSSPSSSSESSTSPSLSRRDGNRSSRSRSKSSSRSKSTSRSCTRSRSKSRGSSNR